MTPDSLTLRDGRTVLRIERPMPHPPEKVWRALTTPEHLARWFPSTVRLDLREGGEIVFDDGDTRGVVTALDPPRLFAFSWGDSDHLRWEVHPADDGSVLVLHHAFSDHYGAASFATGWSACVEGLSQVLAGEEPAPTVDMTARHEEYVHEFDLDAPVTEGDTIRIERQLTAPADAARPLLDPPVLGGGTVRWELVEGTGHGARLVVVATGPFDVPVTEAAQLLRARVQEIAATLAPRPVRT
ncbi:SRPBCC family protein [Pseudonocardia yuanmonensis]|uniref:SRPBCC family protein n=1 Tax=Pseudonocardia yuanmonensis TaxID=1095914 RepID=A0ABP8WX23_9PSEU